MTANGAERSSPATPTGADETTSNYAQRETQSPQIADFRGGEAGVYIGGSGVALVLLIVLLVILL